MVSEAQHARSMGYSEGYTRAAGIYSRAIEKLRVEMAGKDKLIGEQADIIAVMQQSLDEANARIEALTPTTRFQVGDEIMGRFSGSRFTVTEVIAEDKYRVAGRYSGPMAGTYPLSDRGFVKVKR